MISQFLKDILICPGCNGTLKFGDASADCGACGAVYEIRGSIPIMMPPNALKTGAETGIWEDYWNKTPMHDPKKVKDEPDIMSAYSHVKPLWDKYGKEAFFEAGCGSGRLLYLMGMSGIPVIGYDTSTAALEFTSRFLTLAGIKNFHLVCGDMRSLPFKNGSLGMIYGGGSIEHFDGQQKAIDEMFRASAPEGVLTLTYPYISISTLTYRQLFGNIPDIPVIKQFYRFMHEFVFRKKFMRFGYEKSFTIGKMEKFFRNSGFGSIRSGLFDTYLQITFIKNEKIKNFMRGLSRFKPFWPMVYTTGIKNKSQ